MKNIAKELLRKKNEDEDGSLVAVWTKQDDSEEWAPYFHLLSDHSYDARTEFFDESALLAVREVDIDSIVSYVPTQEERGVGSHTIAVEIDDLGTLPYEFQSDIRLKRRTSQEMDSWGIQYPALCFEHWINTDDVVHPTSDTQDQILSELSEIGIELAKNIEFIGNILVAITDRQAIVDKNDVGENILEKRRNNRDSLSDEEWLELYDDWKVELFDLTLKEIDLTLRWEEFGETLYEVPVNTSSQNSISQKEAIEAISEDGVTGGIQITSQGSIVRYPSPSAPVTGASDLVLELTHQGVVIDRYSQELIRSIGFSVNISASGAQSTENEPPKLFEESDHVVGNRAWDHTVTLNSEESQQSWVVDGQDDINEVMTELFSRFDGTVKICDPYLRPDRISEFIQNTEAGSDLWVVVGHASRYMENMREDLKQNIQEADDQNIELRILWIPGGRGSNSPLHDRFILSTEGGLTIGTSFNSLNSNISYVTETAQADAVDLETNFDRWWQDRMFRERHNVEEIIV